MCTVAKQVPSLRWWVAWGLTDCAQAPPPPPPEPALVLVQLPVVSAIPAPASPAAQSCHLKLTRLQCLLSSFWCQAGFVW